VDWVKTLARKGSGAIAAEHFQYRRQPAGAAVLHLVLLDMSSSMLRAGKLAKAKGFLMALMRQAYRDREYVGVIGFGGLEAKWVQRPSKARAFNESWVAPLGGGGGTPLDAALKLLMPVLGKPGWMARVWVLTDGRFAHIPESPKGMDECVIVDVESDALMLRRCKVLADQWQAQWIHIA
jgi:magnesium chelatase subunit ChlD-like protein